MNTPAQRFDHEPVVPPRIVRAIPRIDPELLDALDVSACDVADAVGPLYVMDSGIRPLYSGMPRLVGQALTAKAWPNDNLAVHGALALAQSGDVLVVDWRGLASACGAGAQVLSVPRANGLRGVVIDGAWRDIDELRTSHIPIFGRGLSPTSPPKMRPGEINVAVACGGVVVQPGDVVVADDDGVVVVPRAHLVRVVEALRSKPAPPIDDADRARRAASRRAYFESMFKDAVGVEEDWVER